MTESNRRRIILAASAAALAFTATRAGATQFLYDGFDYTVGDRLGGSGTSPLGQIAPNGEQWITRSPAGGGTWTASRDTEIVSGNLNFGGVAPSLGSSVRYGDSASTNKYTDAIRLPGGVSITSGSVYYSALVRFNSNIPTTPISGVRTSYASFSNETANLADAGLGLVTSTGVANNPLPASAWIRNSGATDFHLGGGKQNGDGLGTSAGAPSWQAAGAPFANQQGNTTGAGQDWATVAADTYFVVMKYTFGSPGTNNDDTVSMWINPIASTLGTNSGETAAGASGGSYYSAVNAFTAPAANLDAGQIQSFVLIGLAQSSTSTTKTILTDLDELRIGTTWADVTTAGLIWDGDAAGGSNPSDTSGSWTGSSNWYDGSTNKDWASYAAAVFGTGAGAGSTTVTVSSAQTAGKLVFNAASPTYTVSGSSITLNGADGQGIVANQSATVSSDINVAAAQTWIVATGATLTAGNVSGSAALKKSGAGAVVANHVRTSDLNVAQGLMQIASNGGSAGTSAVNTVAVAAGAKLDLVNNDLVVRTTPTGSWNGTAYDGVTALVAAGRNGGAWDGSGIVTSESNAISPNKLTTLAVASAADALGLSGAATALWSGQTVSATDTLVKYTYGGDANLSGKIDADDYFQLDSNYGKTADSVKKYFNGDFNYDGLINSDDYFIIDANYSAQGAALGPPAGVSAVPEPASLSLLALGAASMLSRSRRRRA